jgi:hypothetical protein
MNKKIVTLIIAVLVFAAACSGCADKRPKYKNSALEFFLHYNPAWEVKERIGSSVVAFLAPRAEDLDYFQETMTITIDDLLNPLPLDEYTKAVTEQIKALGTMKDVTLNMIDSQPIKVSGKPAHKLVYSLTQYGNPPELVEKGLAPRIDAEGETIQMMLVWTIRENRVYLFTYVAQKNSYETFVKDVDAMIESFRFL